MLRKYIYWDDDEVYHTRRTKYYNTITKKKTRSRLRVEPNELLRERYAAMANTPWWRAAHENQTLGDRLRLDT